ncbi:efflux RND transporter periplasmic adaptor subunit [Desulfobacter postgatei]|jgi:HlyD family secretion protein|uniref:efflux RND transporter periplasmic adaptor subunit n=1 Tax=Desulfobacter postgatei TaxID=2293 RepID=UPI002A367841|nr:efflux RND transporter periplasmic adaptor subunit [Desulfobacter postgatei]MDX9962918.1 efflux RND transporter periplasmic adaptor subunit [Desulfobacter postgatei]
MKKKVFPLIILILAAAGAYIYWQDQNKKQDDENAGTFKIYGTIDIRDASLAFTEQERIETVLVEEGMRVKKGQVLAKLRTAKLDAAIRELQARIAAQQETVAKLEAGNRSQEIDQARSEVQAARARVENVSRTAQRLQATSRSGATSIQNYDDAKAQLKVDQAQLSASQKALDLLIEGPRKEDIAAARHQLDALGASLDQLQVRLSDMTLTAPADGIIQSRILEQGELAGPSKPAFVLALCDPKWVRAYIPEPMLGKINLGMTAQIFTDSLPDQPLDGWVGFISPVAEFTPRAVATEDLRTQLVYETRVFVKDPKDILRLGTPVTVAINDNQTQARPNVPAEPAN